MTVNLFFKISLGAWGLGFSDGVEPVFWGKLWEQIGVSADPPPLGFDFCFRYSSMGNGGLKTD